MVRRWKLSCAFFSGNEGYKNIKSNELCFFSAVLFDSAIGNKLSSNYKNDDTNDELIITKTNNNGVKTKKFELIKFCSVKNPKYTTYRFRIEYIRSG
jgi:hypothetical protein